MQTHQAQPPPPQPRIATTHELMLPYAEDLVRMKAKGASHSQMLTWLHTQGVYSNLAEIATFWPYHAGSICSLPLWLCGSAANPNQNKKIPPNKPNFKTHLTSI